MFGIDDAALAIGGASIVSGFLGADASDRAASATRDAAGQATALQRYTYNTTRKDLQPFTQAGTSALQYLSRLTGVPGSQAGGRVINGATYNSIDEVKDIFRKDYASKLSADGHNASEVDEGAIDRAVAPIWQNAELAKSDAGGTEGDFGSLIKPFNYSLADFYKDPSYQFRLDEGNKALERSASSRGLAQSTPGLKQLMQWNQDYASTEYGNAFSRAFGVDQSNKNTSYNFLSGIAGMGQNAAAMTGSVGASTANGAASALIAGGQATSAGILGGASAINNSIQGGLGNYMYNQRYQQMMQRMPVFGTPPTTGGGSVPAGGVYGRDF